MLLSAAHQRRLIVAAVVLFQSGDWGGGWKKRLPAVSWVDHVARLNEAEFKQRYRLSSDSFYKLRDILRPELDVSHKQNAFNTRSGKPIELEARLACALRFFAGGDPSGPQADLLHEQDAGHALCLVHSGRHHSAAALKVAKRDKMAQAIKDACYTRRLGSTGIVRKKPVRD